jgi:alginate O-acetyltransferase complex protein AlgI
MLFTEPRFALFISVVLVVYWLCRSNTVRKNILLASSYVFYGAWDWRFALMLGALSTADYFFARGIITSDNSVVRKVLVICSACMNIFVLFVFKYFNFFTENAVRLANVLHVNLDYPTIHLVLPVGVSFFTFQSLSYTIDVYRREMPPAKSLRDYLLFAAFFPQLVAGPIVRPKIFLPQLDTVRGVSSLEVRLSLLLFLVGFAKKMCIADNISPYVDEVFSNPAPFGNLSIIASVWLYTVQIYCDFSGYSDMAIAVAALLGYKLCVNFDAPYLATSIQEFWRRWHMSLSTWIRDYIYVSLGGRSSSRIRTYRNLLMTMLAGGLWHGAAWTYVAWGAAHGVGQIVHQEYRHRLQHATLLGIGSLIGWLLTINFVCVCWILFRAPNFATSGVIIGRYFGLAGGGTENVPLWLLTLPPALLLLQLALRRFRMFLRVALLDLESYALVCGSIVSFIIAMLPFGYKPFIYFQF